MTSGRDCDGLGPLIARLFQPAPDWYDRADCRDMDPAIFYPERGGDTRTPKRICWGCGAREQCLAHGLGERYGVWGGRSEKERQRLRRRGPVPVEVSTGPLLGTVRSPIPHGTNAGYRAHQRRRETPCDVCREAHVHYERDRRAERRSA